MTRGVRNSLGALRAISGVDKVHLRSDGVTVVMFNNGTAMRVPPGNAYTLRQEAERLTLRAQVLRAVATNKDGVKR